LSRFAAAVLASALWLACREPPPNATPEGAVRELARELAELDGDTGSGERAFVLLSEETRKNLELRAERYSAASGKHIPPHRMLAPASFNQRFEAERYESEIRGNQALVKVYGVLEDDFAAIPCVLEDGLWRVHVELPPLPPVVVRPRDEAPRK
jgi:hypothetical protein